jgi:hypothetical protein
MRCLLEGSHFRVALKVAAGIDVAAGYSPTLPPTSGEMVPSLLRADCPNPLLAYCEHIVSCDECRKA